MFLITILITVFTLLYITLITYNLLISPLKSLPGPLLSQIFPFYDIYHILKGSFHIHILNLHTKYGPVVRIAGDRVSISDPKLLNLVHGSYKFDKSDFYESVTVKGRNMVSINDQQDHRIRRRAIARTFAETNTNNLESQVLNSGITPLINKLVKNKDKVISIDDEFHSMSLDIIGQLIFGQNLGLLENKHHPILDWSGSVFIWSIMTAMIPPLRLIGNKPLMKIYNFAESSVNTRLNQMKQNPTMVHNDILQGMMNAKDSVSGDKISKVDLCEDIAGLLLAGSDSTTHTLTWTLYLILTNPQIKNQLITEITTNFNKTTNKPSWKQIQQNLPLLNNIIKESLRLFPVASLPVLRKSPGIDLNNHYIPKDTEVFTMLYSHHRDPKYWINPDEFIPDRWLDNNNNEVKDGYHPFLLGPRACPGRSLAIMELSLTIVWLFLMLDVDLVDDGLVLNGVAHMVLKPAKGERLLVRVNERL